MLGGARSQSKRSIEIYNAHSFWIVLARFIEQESTLSAAEQALIIGNWWHDKKDRFKCRTGLARKLSKVNSQEKKDKIRKREEELKGCNWNRPKQGHIEIMGLRFKHCPCNYEYQGLHHYYYLLDCWLKNHLPGPGSPLEQDSKDMQIIRLLEQLHKEHEQYLKAKAKKEEERDK